MILLQQISQDNKFSINNFEKKKLNKIAKSLKKVF